jgi:hypothetical protein
MRYLASFLVLVGVYSSGWSERPGMAFLRLCPDARGGVLHGGMAVAATDATALRHNPALLGRLEGMNLFVSHHEWVQDIRQEFAAVALGGGSHHLGLGFGYVDYGALEYRETASSKPLGTFHPNDLEVLLGYGLRYRDELSVGVAVRFLHEKILDAEATGFSADAGVWRSWPDIGLTAGAGVQHLGAMGALDDEESRLPLTYRVAVAWSDPVGTAAVVVGCQAFSTPGIGGGAGAFGEYTYHRVLVLRCGLAGGEVSYHWAIGAGIDLGRGSLDYAYVPVAQDLGSSHRLSLSIWP